MAKSDKKLAENLPVVEVADATTTKGDKTKPVEPVATIENPKKGEIFAQLKSKLVVTSDLNTIIALAIKKGVTDFQEFIKDAQEAIKSLNSKTYTFAEFIELAKEKFSNNWNDLLSVCGVSEFKESNYCFKGLPVVYHSSQTENSEKTYKTEKVTIGTDEVVYYWETKPATLENWIQSIRYYSVKTTAIQSAINKSMKSIKDEINSLVFQSIVKNGSSKTLELIKSVLA